MKHWRVLACETILYLDNKLFKLSDKLDRLYDKVAPIECYHLEETQDESLGTEEDPGHGKPRC